MKNKIINLLILLILNSCIRQTKTQGLIRDENMELPVVTYDFPENKSNPFDMSSDDKFFIYASGFTNLTNDLDDFNIDTLGMRIPMGYKTIIICQKICFLSEGKVIKNWAYNIINGSESEINGKYYLYTNKKRKTFLTDWKRDVDSYSVLRSSKDASIYSYLWETYDEAEEFAKEISSKEDVTVMISMVINTISWH